MTLTELMIAMGVLSMAILGLVSVQMYAFQSSQGNRNRHTAATLASAIMASIEHSTNENFNNPQSSAEAPVSLPGGNGFTFDVVDKFEDSPANTLRTVTVTVHWREEQSRFNYRLSTRFLRR